MKGLTAIGILRAAVERSSRETVRTKEVRAALRALQPRLTDRSRVDAFWDSAGSDNDIGCSQNVRAAFRSILHQLALPDE